MNFDSFVFLFRFLPLILILYYAAPGRMKNYILVLGSLVFYAWGVPLSILIILFLSVVDYFLGRLIEANGERPEGKILLITSIVMNLFMLFVAGYYDEAAAFINQKSGLQLPILELGIPAGIFLFVLKVLSYHIDLYKKEVKAQKSFLDFMVYSTFFLQFPAGPVLKYKQEEKYLKSRKIDICAIQKGSVRFVRGLAQKVLLADNLGNLWEIISNMNFSTMSLVAAWIGMITLSLRIYFEFAGYAEMAEGAASLFGFSVPQNFNYPYTAFSVTDFWKRWYISLAEWFKQYVYNPLTKKSGKKKSHFPALILTWVLLGMWFGPGIHFVCWGLWVAVFLGVEKLFLKKVLNVIPHAIGRVYTFLVVLLGWIFFTFDEFEKIFGYIRALFGINSGAVIDRQALFLLTENQILLVVSIIFCMPLFGKLENRLKKSNSGYGVAAYRFMEKSSVLLLLFLSLIFMAGK